MNRPAGWVVLAACLAGTSWAQNRDFLTTTEVEQVRETQEPNARIALYAKFAKLRVDMLMQTIEKQKPGRSAFIHDTLEDYTHIIEAIDTVADDALRRKLPIEKGMQVVVAAEKDFLERLKKIEPMQLADLSRYQFVLTEAVDTTSDSLELSTEDAGKRQTEVQAEEQREKKEREAGMSTKEAKERKQQSGEEEQQKKKIPTLYRPGEKPPDQQP